jgi:hypothetical protein
VTTSPNKKGNQVEVKKECKVYKGDEAIEWSFVLRHFPDLFASSLLHFGSWARAVEHALAAKNCLTLEKLYSPLLCPRAKTPETNLKELATKANAKKRQADKKRKKEDDKAHVTASTGASIPAAAAAGASAGAFTSSESDSDGGEDGEDGEDGRERSAKRQKAESGQARRVKAVEEGDEGDKEGDKEDKGDTKMATDDEGDEDDGEGATDSGSESDIDE